MLRLILLMWILYHGVGPASWSHTPRFPTMPPAPPSTPPPPSTSPRWTPTSPHSPWSSLPPELLRTPLPESPSPSSATELPYFVMLSLSFTPFTLILTICSSMCSGITLYLALRKKWLQRKNKPSAEYKSAFAQGLKAAHDPLQAPRECSIPLTSIPPTPPPGTAPIRDQELEWDHMSVSKAPLATPPPGPPTTPQGEIQPATTHPLEDPAQRPTSDPPRKQQESPKDTSTTKKPAKQQESPKIEQASKKTTQAEVHHK